MERPGRLVSEDELAVEAKLFDGRADVGRCAMVDLLVQLGHHTRIPSIGELADGADVDVPVAQMIVQIAHVAAEEAPIERDRVAAEGGGAPVSVLPEKGQRLLFRLS